MRPPKNSIPTRRAQSSPGLEAASGEPLGGRGDPAAPEPADSFWALWGTSSNPAADAGQRLRRRGEGRAGAGEAGIMGLAVKLWWASTNSSVGSIRTPFPACPKAGRVCFGNYVSRTRNSSSPKWKFAHGPLTAMATFRRVAELGSLSAVARAAGLPKSTVSKQVAALEAHLGARLLNRTTRRLSLTEVGRAYLERCRVILEEVEEAEALASSLQMELRDQLVRGGHCQIPN